MENKKEEQIESTAIPLGDSELEQVSGGLSLRLRMGEWYAYDDIIKQYIPCVPPVDESTFEIACFARNPYGGNAITVTVFAYGYVPNAIINGIKTGSNRVVELGNAVIRYHHGAAPVKIAQPWWVD